MNEKKMRTFTLTLYYKSISIKIIIIHLVCKKQFINEKIEFIKNCIIHSIIIIIIISTQYFSTVVFIIIIFC